MTVSNNMHLQFAGFTLPSVTNEDYIVPVINKKQRQEVEYDLIKHAIEKNKTEIAFAVGLAFVVGLCNSRYKDRVINFCDKYNSLIRLGLVVYSTFVSSSYLGGSKIDIFDPSRNLNRKAKKQEIQSATGREQIRQEMIQTLFAQNKPNVLLVGEPGVGKTALVEGLAHYLNELKETDPSHPAGKFQIVEIRASEFISGASFFGSMEARLETFIKSLESERASNLIVFIDEAHMLMQAKGTTATKDFLKPMLARGKSKFICATTNQESKMITEDGALARRFHILELPAPDSENLLKMVKLRTQDLANYHQVTYSVKSVKKAIEISKQLPGNYPDKAITLLDLAGAKTRLEPSRVRSLGSSSESTMFVRNPRLVSPSNIEEVAARQLQQLAKKRREMHSLANES